MLIRNHEIPMVDLQEDARANDAIDISAMESTGKARVVRTDTIALDWNILNSGERKVISCLKMVIAWLLPRNPK